MFSSSHMYSPSHPTSYPYALAGFSPRDRYLDALAEVKAAEANYLAAEAVRREEEAIARSLAQIEMRKQAELVRAAHLNRLNAYQADYAPFPLYAQRRGLGAGMNPSRSDDYHTFAPLGYMPQKPPRVTFPTTFGSTARTIADCENMAPAVALHGLQFANHLERPSPSKKPTRPIVRRVPVPQQPVSKPLDNVGRTKQTKRSPFSPLEVSNSDAQLLNSLAAFFGVDMSDHPVAVQQQQGPISTTTRPGATEAAPTASERDAAAAAMTEFSSWFGVDASGALNVKAAQQAPPRTVQPDAVEDKHLLSKTESDSSQDISTITTHISTLTSTGIASPELESSFSKIRAIESAFNTLKASFTLPAELDFVQIPSSPSTPSSTAPSDSDSETSNVTDHLTYSPLNRPVRSYEQALTVFLTELDSVESLGDAGVRKSRKEVVERVEKALEELERELEGLWKIRVSKSDIGLRVSVGGSEADDAVPVLYLDTPAEVEEVNDNGGKPSTEAVQESPSSKTVKFDEIVYSIPSSSISSSSSVAIEEAPGQIYLSSNATSLAKDADPTQKPRTPDVVEAASDAISTEVLAPLAIALPTALDASSHTINDSPATSTAPSESIIMPNLDTSSTLNLLAITDASAPTQGLENNTALEDTRVDVDVDEWLEVAA